jgi:hypothetical protein
LKPLKEKGCRKIHTQEVIGSRPVGPINEWNNLGGSKWPAFFYAHTNAHTEAGWWTEWQQVTPPDFTWYRACLRCICFHSFRA